MDKKLLPVLAIVAGPVLAFIGLIVGFSMVDGDVPFGNFIMIALFGLAPICFIGGIVWLVIIAVKEGRS